MGHRLGSMGRTGALSISLICTVLAAGLAAAPARARGSDVALHAAFTPDRLGASIAVSFHVTIEPPPGGGPVPTSSVEVGYPSDLGLITSGLGLEACDPATLLASRGHACPPDSALGGGSARIAVPFGPQVVGEAVVLRLYAVPSSDGYLHIGILAVGTEPVQAAVLLDAILVPGRLQIDVPAIEGISGGPDVSLTDISVTLGGALRYAESVHGHTVTYRPKGIQLPESCPRGGWPISTAFTFVDGSSGAAHTRIPCPPARGPRRRPPTRRSVKT